MWAWGQMATVVAAAATAQVRQNRRRGVSAPGASGLSRWLGEPRNAVFLVLTSAVLVGGGRKLLHWWRARTAMARLGEPDVTVAEVEAAAAHGRTGLMDLFRILGTTDAGPLRDAAGRALAELWAQDNLITEEEKALVLRGFSATWRARRRYPRGIRAPIPVSVSYGVSFLRPGAPGIGPENLEWSHRIMGTRRAGLESFSPWTPGQGLAEFSVFPDDFDTGGPHRLILHARVRTAGLTDAWELELPQTLFHLEFDPQLSTDALFALADAGRAESIGRAVRLESPPDDDSRPADYLALSEGFAMRNPPALVVAPPLPCDLAHSLSIEIEGVPGTFPAGAVVLSGQGVSLDAPAATRRYPLELAHGLGADLIDRPGARRIRAHLTADPDRGWGDPDVRSIWPGTIATDWTDVTVVRR